MLAEGSKRAATSVRVKKFVPWLIRLILWGSVVLGACLTLGAGILARGTQTFFHRKSIGGKKGLVNGRS